MTKCRNKLLAATALSLAAGPAAALELHLVAQPFTKTMPDGMPVPMWGFALDADGPGGNEPDAPSVPGPAIKIPPGDNQLTVHLHNELPVPVSLMIPGQAAPTDPTWVDTAGAVVATGARPTGDVTSRMRSIMTETPPNATGTYTWDNLRPGTFLYHSSTHMQVQVPMGLYGAMVKDAASGEAYPGITYDNQALLVLSEVDPDLNQAVADGIYGTEDFPSAIGYTPRYFLVNGESFPAADPGLDAPILLGETVLLRLVNAGLQAHVPQVEGMRLQVVAEDGYPYPHPRDQYGVLLAPAKTRDAIISAEEAQVAALFDRALNLTNRLDYPGGMMVHLRIPGVGPIAADDLYAAQSETPLGVPASGVLENDDGAGLAAVLVSGAAHGAVSLAADGGFTYTPDAGFAGEDAFTYVAEAPDGATSNEAEVAIMVAAANAPPDAVVDAYGDLVEDTPYSVSAPGVLDNDSDPEGDALSAALAAAPAHGSVTLNADGGFTYVPAPNYAGPDSFTYAAQDAAGNAAQAEVSLTIAPVNDAPASASDQFAMNGTSLEVPAPGVLGNDTDADGDDLTAVLMDPPQYGDITLAADGSFTYTAGSTFAGADSFTYAAHDGTVQGNTAMVTIMGNAPPVARDDSASVGSSREVAEIPVTANDSDPDGQIDHGSVVITSPPGSGTVVVNGDGSVTYTPARGSSGTDTFTYTVDDNHGATSNEAVVSVTVGGGGDDPRPRALRTSTGGGTR